MSIEARFKLVRSGFTLDVEFSIPAQGVTAIFGPSGSGKTSLLRLIAGLDIPTEGYLKVDHDIWQQGDEFLPAYRRRIAYVFQEAELFPHLNVAGNLEYGFKRVAKTKPSLAFDEVVELLELGNLLDRSPNNLSGGEQKRVAIGRALLTNPKLLLMDEPLSGIDPKKKQDILPFLERLHYKLDIPVLYVSHMPEEVAQLADHLILLDRGKISATGAMNDLLTSLDLPMAQDIDAAAVIDTTISTHDNLYNLTQLSFNGGRLTVPQQNAAIGQKVRLQIFARDVSLALQHSETSSILNILPATIEALTNDDTAYVTVRLAVGGTTLLSRVTRKSAVALKLHSGKNIYAQIKSVALLAY